MTARIKAYGLVMAALFALAVSGRAQGTAFSYQGHLSESGAAAAGPHDLVFSLFDAANAGNQIGASVTINSLAINNGLFNVTLDFGANVFDGNARWLEISVRHANAGAFTKLDGRVAVLPNPYAIYAATAGKLADNSVAANQLKTSGAAPVAGQFLSYNGGSLVWTDAAVAAGSLWSPHGTDAYYTAGNIGIGTNAPTPGVRLEVNGNARITPGGQGGFVQIGTPNGETGMGIIGTSRADVRFDGKSLKLLAGSGQTPPADGVFVSTNGNVGIAPGFLPDGSPFLIERLTVGGGAVADTKIRIDAGGDTYAALLLRNANASWLWQITPSDDLPGGRMRLTDEFSGAEAMSITQDANVGIGTPAPAHRLSLIGGPLWTANSWTGALELGNASAIGWRANAGGQRFGIGQSTGGLYIFRTDSDPGTKSGPAKYDVQVTDNGTLQANGNATQARDKGGFAKAMIHVNANGFIMDCYNGVTGASFTGATLDSVCGASCCGFKITSDLYGVYVIDFGFQVTHRFVSVTPEYIGGFDTKLYNRGANYRFRDGAPTIVEVFTFVADNVDDTTESRFTIIVY